VRAFGIGFGLPQTLCRPDELQIADRVFYIYRGDPLHQFFTYPTLFMYLMGGVYGLYYAFGQATGRFQSLFDLAVEFHDDPSMFLLLGRWVSVLLGTATVLLTYMVARRLLDRTTARVAAVFLALTHLHVRDAHFATTDVTTTFFLMGAMLCVVRCRDARSAWPYAAAGVLAGLCASTKYIGVLVAVPLFIVHVFNVRDQGRGWRGWLDARPAAFAGAVLLAFAVGTPRAVLEPVAFFEFAWLEVGHFSAGHGAAGEPRWWHHLSFSLLHGMGWSLLGAALVGALVLAARRPRTAAVLLAFPLCYFAIAGLGSTAFARYMIPMLPFLCVTAAYFAAVMASGLARAAPRIAPAATALLAALVVLPSLVRVVALDRLLARDDTRLQAQRWIEAQVPQGSTVCMTASYGRVKLPPHDSVLLELKARAQESQDPTNEMARLVDERLRLREKTGMHGYRECAYLPEQRAFRLRFGQLDGLPDHVVVSEPPAGDRATLPLGLQALLDEHYAPVASFVGHAAPLSAARYDPLDAFYLPFAGYSGIERPGPNIHVYSRK